MVMILFFLIQLHNRSSDAQPTFTGPFLKGGGGSPFAVLLAGVTERQPNN